MRVDAPSVAQLFCRDCQTYHYFYLDTDLAAYVPAVETLIPESLLHIKDRCRKIIDVRTLLVQYASVTEFGVTELVLPRERL